MALRLICVGLKAPPTSDSDMACIRNLRRGETLSRSNGIDYARERETTTRLPVWEAEEGNEADVMPSSETLTGTLGFYEMEDGAAAASF